MRNTGKGFYCKIKLILSYAYSFTIPVCAVLRTLLRKRHVSTTFHQDWSFFKKLRHNMAIQMSRSIAFINQLIICNFRYKNYGFKNPQSIDMNKSPRLTRIRELWFTCPILYPLGCDDIQPIWLTNKNKNLTKLSFRYLVT